MAVGPPSSDNYEFSIMNFEFRRTVAPSHPAMSFIIHNSSFMIVGMRYPVDEAEDL
jgi:hypothetical protein